MDSQVASTKYNLFRESNDLCLKNISCGGLRIKNYSKKNQPKINLPLFSIITVVYNNFSQIQRCMDSVFNQTYQNIEYIIIDGSSNDGTLDIIKSNEAKIDLWISEKDKGIYDAINKGINFAKGYTLMLHSDDIISDQYVLEKISKFIKKEDTLYFARVKNYNEYVKWIYPTEKNIVSSHWHNENMIPHQSSFIFADLHRKFLFDDPKLSIGNDAFVLGNIAKKHRVEFIDLIAVDVQLGGDSNNWKSLKKVYEYNAQTHRVLKKLDRGPQYKNLLLNNLKGTVLFLIFNLFGRKIFYKIIYRKYKK
jgi:glycosyltransferase involved in cell wall biosynthesis